MNTTTTTTTLSADRLRARRAASQANREQLAQAAATAALLAEAARSFGEDAVQTAWLKAYERAANDPDTCAYKNARGERMNNVRATVARRRREENQLKYADRWVPGDPTGEAATSRAKSKLLLAVDSFSFPTTARRGSSIAWDELSAHFNVQASLIEDLTIGELDATGLRGHGSTGKAGSVLTRAKYLDRSPSELDRLRYHADQDPAPREGRPTMIAVERPARAIHESPARSTFRALKARRARIMAYRATRGSSPIAMGPAALQAYLATLG